MNILVLLGGGSAEREISWKTGMGIVAALKRRGHCVVAGDPATGLTVPGTGPEALATTPRIADGADRLLPEHLRALVTGASECAQYDVVFVALHGGAGEDGTVQTLLDLAQLPYTGSGPLASALAMDKVMAKRLFVWAGVPTPDWVELSLPEARALAQASRGGADEPGSAPRRLAGLGGLPIVVKPVDQGSTIGLTVVRAWDELPAAIETAARYGTRILSERFIPGRELAVGILGDGALPIVEIEPTKGIYDYECKYTKGMSRYTCPAALSEDHARAVRQAAVQAFRALACSDFGRVDIRLAPEGRAYVLEVNTIPGMTETSLLPMAAGAVGMSYEELVERMCELALSRGREDAAPHAGSARPGTANPHPQARVAAS